MICQITRVNEGSTIVFELTFKDKNEKTYSINYLSSVRWQLSDKDGNIINNRSFANGLLTEPIVVLTGEDLKTAATGTRRFFAVEAEYNSTLGADLKATAESDFVVNDLVNI